jgi:hypothetical protein
MASSQLQPRSRIADYELLRLLGRGGMGDVWLGHELSADRAVAIKFIKPHLLEEPTFLNRFLNEARTLGRLEHDRIVRLHRVLQSEGHVALILGYIEGQSLADIIDARAPMPLDVVLKCARDVLPALAFAHQRGIIHRDIKPQNILVDREERSFLCDFGIAVVEFADRGTETGFAIGTPHYMSPEQIQTPRDLTTQKGGHRSDIYSFGVVLFEMLTGRLPFGTHGGSDESFQVQSMHCMTPAPPLRGFHRGVPQPVEEVVLRCLEKKPQNRPQTCKELLEMLESAGRGVPTTAGVSTRGETVFEGSHAGTVGGTIPTPVAPLQQPPRDVQRPSRGRRAGMPKLGWLVLGGVLIAGAIGYAVLTSSKTESAEGSGKTVVADTSRPDAIRPDTLPPKPDGGNGGQTLPKPTTLSDGRAGAMPQQSIVPAPDPSAALGAEARQLMQDGKACDAEPRAQRASELNPQYRSLYASAAAACTDQKMAAADASAAEQLLKDGDYCGAQNKMKTALNSYPAERKYSQRLKVMTESCEASLR